MDIFCLMNISVNTLHKGDDDDDDDDNNNNNNNNNNILSEDSDCWECSFKEAFYSCPL